MRNSGSTELALLPVNLYVGNHRSLEGLGDWVRESARMFGRAGAHIEVSDAYVARGVNLVIDEFSVAIEAEAAIRAAQSGPFILAISEFITTDKSGGMLLNTFERDALLRDSFQPHSPFATVSNVRRGVGAIRYMAKRARGLERVLRNVTPVFILLGHPAMRSQLESWYRQNLLDAPPMLDCWGELGNLERDLFRNAYRVTIDALTLDEEVRYGQTLTRPIVVQGHPTAYRTQFIQNLRRSRRFMLSREWPMTPNLERNELRAQGYDLIIPRSRDWTYLSPFRIMRSLRRSLLPVMQDDWCRADGSAWNLLISRFSNWDDLDSLFVARKTAASFERKWSEPLQQFELDASLKREIFCNTISTLR